MLCVVDDSPAGTGSHVKGQPHRVEMIETRKRIMRDTLSEELTPLPALFKLSLLSRVTFPAGMDGIHKDTRRYPDEIIDNSSTRNLRSFA